MTEEQLDKIKGVFYGQAIGDALGLGTEFLDKQKIAEYYPNGLSAYADIVQDRHRSRWVQGDWTDDTDQFLCICNAILKSGRADELAFAEELYKWFKGAPTGIGTTVYKVLSLPQFTLYPHKGAELVWKMSRKQNASNGAIMRTSILGTYDFNDYSKVISNTETIAKVTHWDNRCIGSCVVVTLLIAHIISESKYLDKEQLIEIGNRYDPRIEEYIELASSSKIENIELDEATTIGYTLKAMAAGLWTYFHATNFEEGLLKVIYEGGDADTNACVAGSILGAKFGYSAIPKKYIEGLAYQAEFEKVFNEYIQHLIQKKNYN